MRRTGQHPKRAHGPLTRATSPTEGKEGMGLKSMRPRPRPEVWAGMCPACGTLFRVDVWVMHWRTPDTDVFATHVCGAGPGVGRVRLLPTHRSPWYRLLRRLAKRAPETPFTPDTFDATPGTLFDHTGDVGASWTRHDPEGNGTDQM